MRIRICEHASSAAFEWIARTLQSALRALGHEVEWIRGPFADDGASLHLVLGAHLYEPGVFASMQGRCILYNFEQVDPSVPWMQARYFHLMKQHVVWDYNQRNVQRLQAAGIRHVQHVPVGFEPEMLDTQPAGHKDIDVVFFGTPSDRRNAVLDLLRIRGLTVFQTVSRGVEGDELLGILRRSKVGLNMHFYDESAVFEDLRVAQMICAGLPVVAEIGAHTVVDPDMRACVVGVPYEQLAVECAALVVDDSKRNARAQSCLEHFQSRDFRGQLQKSLKEAALPDGNQTAQFPIPRALQIGAGRKWRYDMVNLDVDASRGADWVWDLNQPLPADAHMQSWRWGRVDIKPGMFDYILSEHVFEHIRELTTAMRTCLDLLGDGGILEIEVPYDLSYGAWQDPTHVRAFNQNSWIYYGDWCWYLGWRTHRFDLISQVFVTSAHGNELLKSIGDADIEALSRNPRAIDALRVKMRKRALTAEEIDEHRRHYPQDNFA